jgi:hypothetical protein
MNARNAVFTPFPTGHDAVSFALLGNDTLAGSLISLEYAARSSFSLGAKVPFVVRPVGNGMYKLIGGCYIHSFMHVEAVKKNEVKEQDIHLV